MIRTLKKSFLLLLALVFIATLVCSCGADKTPAEATEAINSSDATNGSGDSTSYAVNTAVTPVETKAPQDGGDAPSTEVTNAIKEPKMGKLILVSKSETYYTLTVPENIAEDESAVVTEFASRLAELTGGDFHPYCESDFLLDLEIVIANGSTRADAIEFSKAAVDEGLTYAIGVSGERILVYAEDGQALSEALAVFLASVTDNKTDDLMNDNINSFYLPANISIKESYTATVNASDFTLVIPSSMSKERKSIVNEYLTALGERTGAKLIAMNDNIVIKGRRILLNTASDNEQAAELLAKSSYTGYEITAVGDDILISAYSDIAMRAALSTLLATGTDSGKISDTVYVSCDFGVASGVPHLSTAKGVLEGGEIYDANENCYTAAYSGVTENEYLAYRTRLEENDFEAVADNEINNNLFATYRGNGKSVVLAFYPQFSEMDITISPDGFMLPTGKAEKYTVNPDITPSITLMDHELCSYVMQLEDGSFLIVDGGDLNRKGAMDKMWEHITSLTPKGQKPVISLWMLTHAHQDHVLLFVDFIVTHRKDIELKSVAFNFPNFESLDVKNEPIYEYQGVGIAKCANKVYDVLDKYYPDVERWIPRTGQKHSVAGAEIEILFSHEDYYPARVSSGNDTSSIWRITLGGTTTVYLGDATDAPCKRTAALYGENLEADILQLTHHGISGGDLGLYQLIDPKVCFWGTGAERFESERCTGTGEYAHFTYNNWVRNTDWTRKVNGEEVSGARAHYHGSVRTKITLPVT